MSQRQWIEIGIGAALFGYASGLLFDLTPLGRWVDEAIDALWWEVLPWGLLVIPWAGIGIWAHGKFRSGDNGHTA